MEYQINGTLDLSGNEQSIKITTKQGDMNSRTCTFTLMKDGETFTPEAGTIARVSWNKPDGTQVLNDVNLDGSQVFFTLTEQMLSVPGEAECEILLFREDELLSSGVLTVTIMPVSYDTDEIESSDEYQTFINALQEMEVATQNCILATNTATDRANEARDATTKANDATAVAKDAADRANEAARLVENTDFSSIMRRLNTPCTQVTGSLDDVTDSGWYCGDTGTTLNYPPSETTSYYTLLVYKLTDDVIIQEVMYGIGDCQRFTRTYRDQTGKDMYSSWSSWYQWPNAIVVA